MNMLNIVGAIAVGMIIGWIAIGILWASIRCICRVYKILSTPAAPEGKDDIYQYDDLTEDELLDLDDIKWTTTCTYNEKPLRRKYPRRSHYKFPYQLRVMDLPLNRFNPIQKIKL